jgi:glutathione synthase/RimK-type ligase-like ATP-grasp enzyme
MHVALVTAAHVVPETTDDLLLHAALLARGHDATWVPWDDPQVRWRDYDCALLRSCWGYHLQEQKFRAWVEHCARQAVTLLNPPAMVLHNVHKRYLLELAAAGLRVPPLRLLSRGADVDLQATLAVLGAEDAVIKPAVSGTAWLTWRVRELGMVASHAELQKLLESRDMLVQRYEPGVTDQGEWSLVYLDGAYSHAALKVPRPGDFRSQLEFGACVHYLDAPSELKVAAGVALGLLGHGATYARVDMTESPQGPVFMEVELIEPQLFFAARPQAASDLVTNLERRIGLSSSQPHRDSRNGQASGAGM